MLDAEFLQYGDGSVLPVKWLLPLAPVTRAAFYPSSRPVYFGTSRNR